MKIFGIGLAKTGTTSLCRAMRILGFRSTHDFGDYNDYLINILNGTVNFKIISEYDFIGNSFACFYYKLSNTYKNSKFILTIRDEKKWLKSMSYQIKTNYIKKPVFNIISLSRLLHINCINCENEEDLIYVYRRHNNNVLDFFKDQPGRLLVVDVTKNGWSGLCSFLNLKQPNEEFPHLNKSNLFKYYL